MLLCWKNRSVVLVLVVWCLMTVNAHESHTDKNNEEPSKIDDSSMQFQNIQRRFLDLVGNSSSELHSLTEVIAILNTETGKEMGQLLKDGIALGIKQQNSVQVLMQFWAELQGKLSPILLESFNDYRDFFKGVDISTLPLVWDQLFKEDVLGNSLAGLPMGQLVDMLQPTATKYGIDIRALMNSLMGQGSNNVRDLILSALNGTDFSSVINNFMHTASNAMQTSNNDQVHDKAAPKKGKAAKTMNLFRPLVANILKENQIDLDADAVLGVLAPILNMDIVGQASPWIAMLAGQGNKGGIGSMIGNLMGGGQDGFNPQQAIGLISGLGALMGTQEKGQMDMGSILNMASMFMGKPAKKKNRKNNPKRNEREDGGLDIMSLMSMAGQLMGDNVDIGGLLQSTLQKQMKPSAKKPTQNIQNNKQQKSQNIPNKPSNAKQESSKPTEKKTKNILDIIEPILNGMKTDKKCNAKIRDAINMGKGMIGSRISNLGDIQHILSLMMSYMAGSDTLATQGAKLESLLTSFSQSVNKADWGKFLTNLENKEFRQVLIKNIAPNAADLAAVLVTKETQNKIYEAVVPKIQGMMASYGLVGVTLDNFPERLGPMIGLFTNSWKLPFKPTTILVPLKLYLKDLKSWALAGIMEVESLSSQKLESRIIQVLDEDVAESVVKVVQVMRMTPDPHCLPQKLCQVNSPLRPNSLGAAVTRMVSLVAASETVLATTDTKLLLDTVHATSGITGDCRVSYPGNCDFNHQAYDYDDLSTDSGYEHLEL